jgi:hypothetical protein
MKCQCGGELEYQFLGCDSYFICKCGKEYNAKVIFELLQKAEADLASQKAKCDLCHEAQYVEYAKVKAELEQTKSVNAGLELSVKLNQADKQKAEAELDRVRLGMCGNCKRKLLIRGEGK